MLRIVIQTSPYLVTLRYVICVLPVLCMTSSLHMMPETGAHKCCTLKWSHQGAALLTGG